MKLKKQAIVFLVLSLVMLFSTAFAWFNITKVGNVSGIDSNITDFNNLIDFYVKRVKTDDDFTKISTIDDLNEFFEKTTPGESYVFKVELKNHTGADRMFVVELKNIITNFNESLDHDLKDVFYIDQGIINISYFNLTNNELISSNNTTLDTISDTPVDKHGITLNNYRLNNLTKSTNESVIVAQIPTLPNNQRAEVSFELVFDPETIDILYQYNSLEFSGIYIYGQ